MYWDFPPLPGWSHRPLEEYRAYVAGLVEQIEQDTQERRRKDLPFIPGRRQILKAHPHHRPERLKHSPAPRFHTATEKAFKELYNAYAWFVAAYRVASEKLRNGDFSVAFPAGSFPPARPFVPG